MSTKRDYYKVLGLEKTATKDEIKAAYRTLAKKYHPDVNKSANATEMFQEISEAYEVLYDDTKRQQYDRFGHMENNGGFGGFGGFQQQGGFSSFNGNLNDLFGDIFGGFGFGNFRSANQPMRGKSIHQQVRITLEDVYTGKKLKVKKADNSMIDISIPKGVENGMELRIKDGGHEGRNGGPKGYLILQIIINETAGYEIRGRDLYYQLNINYFDLLLGQKITLNYLDGNELKFKFPECTNPHDLIRIKNKGLPYLNSSRFGDLYISLTPQMPKRLSSRMRKQIEDLKLSFI